ncbi:MAG: type II toxin-antitoxin system VapC family toxin [Burkholderiales bacterium]|nr:type II toxin-antitoxin system VapC family toxin [Burkholderiales bacterium]
MSVLLDTHIWVRWLLDAEPLSREEREAISGLTAFGLASISAISLWEGEMLHAKGRLPLNRPFEAWIRQASDPDVVKVLPLDIEVIVQLHRLPARFHGDPADRLIVATARAHGLPLATHDSSIRRSRVVKIWKP